MNFIGTFIKRESGNVAGRLVIGYDTKAVYYLDVLKSEIDDLMHEVQIPDIFATYYVSMNINAMPISKIEACSQVAFDDICEIFDKLCYYETCVQRPQLYKVYDRYLAYIMENEEKRESLCGISKLERR